MTTGLEILIALAAVLLAWWLWRFLLRPRASAEPMDDSEVLAPLRRGPRPASGAVALEEPEEDDNRGLIGHPL